MRFVPVKNEEQTRLSQWQNRRDRLVGHRTDLINQVRGELSEFGIVIPKSPARFRKEMINLQESDKVYIREYLQSAMEELAFLDEKISIADKQIGEFIQGDETSQRLMSVPGVGPITALAIRASVSDPSVFKNGRHFSAWLGLVPRQYSSGEKERLGRISKRGDGKIRCLLIHGARSALRVAQSHPTDRRQVWAEKLRLKKGANKAAVALANQNARTLFALLKNGGQYRPSL